MWAAVTSAFTCRSCAFLAPLDGLALDGSVECAQCGLRQAFDPESWRAPLAFAHDVADLAGPSPEGRVAKPRVWIGSDNPHGEVGVTTTLKSCASSGGGGDDVRALFGGASAQRAMSLDAAPGCPVCTRCAVPLEIGFDGGATLTRCPRCGEAARHVLGERAAALCPTLAGVVSVDDSDRPRARVAASAGGVIALACPACGAPLHATDGRRATCTFCKAIALLPRYGAAPAASGAQVKAQLWWVLFKGPSAARRALETPVIAQIPADGLGLGIVPFGAKSLFKSPGSQGGSGGVDVAPETPQPGLLQIAVTIVCALVALAITYPIVALSSGSSERPTRSHHRH
jgi:hypothetical protein